LPANENDAGEDSMQRLSSLLAGCAALAIGSTAPPTAAAAQDFYAGKTVRILIGLAAGGTVDTLVRSFSIHLRKHIPGNPAIVVQNMPGASTYAAINYLAERAPRDGLTIVYNPYHPLGQAYGEAALRTRYDQFEFLSGMGDTRVNYIRRDAVPGGLKAARDIMKAQNLIVGANSIGITDFSGVLASLSLAVLGVKHKMVGGYRGGADIFLAMQRGEVQFHNTSIGTFRTRSGPFIRSGAGVGISYLVPVGENGEYERNKYISEMPAYPDLYREVHGKLPSGPLWEAFNWFTNQTGEMTYVGLAPRGTPAPAVAALRLGFERAARDPEFAKESVKRNGIPYAYVTVAKGEAILRALNTVSPALLAKLREATGSQH
jgi:tripartite-type tricarboxylate transporter receptor subunit TctC